MTGHSWSEIDRLFGQALDLAPEDRAAFLEQATGGDEGLQRHVLALLAAAEAPLRDFGGAAASVAAGAVDERRDTRIGPYRIEEELGRGGMGVVYRATREVGGTEQRVALKLIRTEVPHRQDPAGLARFRQEREVLAGLEHPHVARLLDAGDTDDGAPYLAMEFVPGTRITTYCEARALPLPARLALLAQVARAADYAHRRLIVHRDIKPGNVLVAEDEHGRPVPKLLDFGIAKLLGPEAPGAEPLTRTDWRPLTLGYAAPEQLAGDPITTAVDVYALGVLLYEMVTGRRPFERESMAEIEQAVLHDEPRRPSTRTHRATDDPTTPSGVRADALRGDVDVICLKAISREPERRYASAAALADDIDRYLAGLPIEARPATLAYRTQKFVRRHQTAVSAAVAVVAALVIGAGATLHQSREVRVERDRAATEALRAEQTAAFLAGLMELGDPFETDRPIPAAALTDSGIARIDRSDDLDPVLAAELLTTIGNVYKAQGRFEAYEQSVSRAVEVLRAQTGEDVALAQALGAHAISLLTLDRADEAVPPAREAYALMQHRGEADEEYILTTRRLATALEWSGQMEETVAFIDEVIGDAPLESWGGGSDGIVDLLIAQAQALAVLGYEEEAVAAGKDAMRLAALRLEPESQSEQATRHNYAYMLMTISRYAEAEAEFRRVLAVEERQLPPDHPDLANTLAVLAHLGLYTDRPEQVAAYTRRADVSYAEVHGLAAHRTIETRAVGAIGLYRMGDRAAAIAALRRAAREAGPAADPEALADVRFLLDHMSESTEARGRREEGGQATEASAAGAPAALPAERRATLLRWLGHAE